MAADWKEIMSSTTSDERNITHSMFWEYDSYTWKLHEIQLEVSTEERVDILTDNIEFNSSAASDTK